MKTGWVAMGLWVLAAAAAGQQLEVPEGSTALVAITPAAAVAGRVELTLAWRNSWRDAEGSARGNHDGVWVFAKTLHADGRWRLARVAEASAAGGFEVESAADGAGVFVFRNQPGQGDARTTLILRWEGVTGAGSVPEGSQRLRVFAWPMVKVPRGGFELGDGSPNTPGRFHAGDDASRPFGVTAAAIELAPRAGALWADATRTALPAGAPGPTPWDGFTGALAAAYPTGYQAFWIQRYETTQGQYADFLNTLTPAQAAARAPSPSDFAAAGRLRPDNYRFTLEQRDSAWRAGQSRWSMNWLTWDDGTAIADWAGLRPMSELELEFEKAERGRAAAVSDEYAWGTTRIVAIRGFDGVDGSGSVDASGRVYVAGWFSGSHAFANQVLSARSTRSNIFLARLEWATGNVLWGAGLISTLADSASNIPAGLIVDGQGHPWIGGQFFADMEVAQTQLGQASAVLRTSFRGPLASSGNDGFVVRFDARDGSLQPAQM